MRSVLIRNLSTGRPRYIASGLLRFRYFTRRRHSSLSAPARTATPLLDRLLENLQDAQGGHSIEQINTHWSSWRTYDLLSRVPQISLAKLGSFLSEFILTEPSTFSPILEGRLEDVVLDLAHLGQVQPMVALMRRALQKNAPETVLNLWNKYAEPPSDAPKLKDRKVKKGTSTVNTSQAKTLVMTAYAATNDYQGAIGAIVNQKCSVSLGLAQKYLGWYSLPTKLDVGEIGRFIEIVRFAAAVIQQGATKATMSQFALGINVEAPLRIYRGLLSGCKDLDGWCSPSTREPRLVPPSHDLANHTPTRFHFSEPVCVMFIGEFLRCRRLDLAQNVLHDMRSVGMEPTPAVFNIMLDGSGKVGDLSLARSTWSFMCEEKLDDMISRTTMMDILFKNGQVDEALGLFGEVTKNAVGVTTEAPEVSIITYNVVINGLLLCGRLSDSKMLLDKIRKLGPLPDIATYNAFLSYFSKRGQMIECSQTLRTIAEENLQPDVYTFTVMLTRLLRSDQVAGPALLGMMADLGIKLTPVTYSVVIEAIVDRGGRENIKLAIQIVDCMNQERVPPNEVTYGILIKAILRDNSFSTDEADMLLHDIKSRMQKQGLELNRVSRNLLIASGFRRGDGRAADVVSEWNALKHGRVSEKTYYILLRDFLSSGNYEAGREILHHMEVNGFKPQSSLKRIVSQFSKELLKARCDQ